MTGLRGTCPFPHCALQEDHPGAHVVPSNTVTYTCRNCSYAGDDAREAMWHAAENGHETIPAPEGDRLPPLPTAFPEAEAEVETELRAEDVNRIRDAHRRYAFGQIRDTRNRMAEDIRRDVESGKLEGLPLIRATARLESYNDLIVTLENLKGMIK